MNVQDAITSFFDPSFKNCLKVKQDEAEQAGKRYYESSGGVYNNPHVDNLLHAAWHSGWLSMAVKKNEHSSRFHRMA